MLRIHSILFPALLLVACSETEDDSSDENGASGKNSLAATGNNGTEDAGDYELLEDIDGEPFEPDSVEAVYYADEDPFWMLTAKEGDMWLHIENYPRFGGATGAETRTLGTVEVDYSTCGVCVMLKTGCSPHGDHAHCSTTYMPVPGSFITFDELGSGAGGSWTGTLSPVRFVEVSLDNDSLVTTPIEGGDQIELDTWSFDVVLEAE